MILLLEDNSVTRESTAKLLRLRAYQVREAATYTEAMAAVRERMPDLFIVDLILACGRTGLELLREFEKLPGFDRQRVIITTGLPDWLGQEPPEYTVLHKPFPIEDLEEAVESKLAVKA